MLGTPLGVPDDNSSPYAFKALLMGISFREYPSITDSPNDPLAALKSLRIKEGRYPDLTGYRPSS